ncbi:MAG: GNAT family N-acetyltransferase [Clostridia bacterium]|nr:GNAT family N-acetyltransferase [Clostridia bacterium]
MNPEQYLSNPCKASSLPFWKTNIISLPPSMSVVRDDLFPGLQAGSFDTLYFKLLHRLNALSPYTLPNGFSFTSVDEHSMAAHISHCYEEESVSVEELKQYKKRNVYSPDLWIGLKENDSGKLVATGIAEFDQEIKEGVLEWIQVSPDFRRRGLGRFVVNELLIRLVNRADFVTVSGRMNNPNNPYALYLNCGFETPVIWHVVRGQ